MKLLRQVLTFIFLTALVLSASPAASAAQYSAKDFMEPSYCSGCHTTLYNQWKHSAHARAVTDELFQKQVAYAVEDLGGPDNPEAQAIRAFCFDCHSPIGKMIGEVPPKSSIAMSGVSCDFCHTVSGTNGIGNASFVNTPGNVKRGPFVDAISEVHETTLSVLHTQSEFCGMCHDVYHPINGLPLEQTYTEWKNSPYPAKNRQCQHCMMPQMKNVSIASEGPKRPVVFGHTFAGGNFAEGDKTGAIKLLKKAAKIEVATDRTSAKPGDKVFITVKVTNTGAGHMIPTGLTEVRDVWLEIIAVDKDGQKDKVYNERYTTVLEDAQGKHDGTVPMWRAVKIYSDNRLAPNETKTYEKTYKIPAGKQGHYTMVATLNYRTASTEITRALKMKTKPSVAMAIAQKKVMLPGGETASDKTTTGAPAWIIWGGTAVVLLLVFIGSILLMRGGRSDA
ncbi:MAG: multiheme c-type cytochrome [Actinomycetota bacterium]